MKKVLHFLFKKPVGQFLSVGLIFVAVAYLGRLYYVDLPEYEEQQETAGAADRLEVMARTLDENLAGSETPQQLLDAAPEFTAWNPFDLPCGGYTAEFHGDAEIWTLLGIENGAETKFQYRFERRGGDILLRARRDTDCDGLYSTYSLAISSGLTGLKWGDVERHNLNE